MWSVAWAIVFLALFLIVRFTNYNEGLMAAAPNINCQNKTVEIGDAYSDYLKIINQRNADLHCYCKKYYDENKEIKSTLELFQEFDANFTETENPCAEWEFAYNNHLYLTVATGIIISIINSVCVAVFNIIVVHEKSKTYMDENVSKF